MEIFKLLLYKMKRALGMRADYYAVTVGTLDLDTGAKDITKVKTKLRKVISLPTQIEKQFIGTKNLNYQVGDKIIITDEIAAVDSNDYLVIKTKRYNIIDWWELETPNRVGEFVLHVRHTQDESPYQVFDMSVISKVNISEEVSS